MGLFVLAILSVHFRQCGVHYHQQLGLPSKFRSEKILRNRLGTVSLFRGKNAHSAEFRASRNSPFRGSERKGTERIPRKNEV